MVLLGLSSISAALQPQEFSRLPQRHAPASCMSPGKPRRGVRGKGCTHNLNTGWRKKRPTEGQKALSENIGPLMSHAFIFSNMLLSHLSILYYCFSGESLKLPAIHSQSRWWSLCSMYSAESHKTSCNRRADKRPNTSSEPTSQNMLARRPVHLPFYIWGPQGGRRRRVRQLSLFITPFLTLLSFSMWLSLCPAAGMSVSKHEPFECIVILLIIILFIIVLHCYNNCNDSENVHCLYS